jgi:hypothetical protein
LLSVLPQLPIAAAPAKASGCAINAPQTIIAAADTNRVSFIFYSSDNPEFPF